MIDLDRRWAIVALVVIVFGFVGAGVLVLNHELSAGDNGRSPGAWEIAWDYLAAFDEGKADVAAKLTDDPAGAKAALSEVREELPDAKVVSTLDRVRVDGEAATGTFDVSWTLEEGRDWAYPNAMKLVRLDGEWRVHWTPELVHPDLEPGQRIGVVPYTDAPAVVDADGKPLLTWQDAGPQPVKAGRAKLLQPSMLTRAQKRGTPPEWTVAALDGKGKRVRLLDGEGPKELRPVRSTLSIRMQDAAQAAVDTQRKPAVLVALRPSTGGIVAVAQNDAAAQNGPVALSGLYPPGSTFKIVTAAAALDNGLTAESTVPCPGSAHFGARTIKNEGKFDLGDVPLRTAFARSCNTSFADIAQDLSARGLVEAGNRLGLNADFDIPGIATEAGAVRKAADEAQLVENAIGQGEVRASPFGVAMISATVAAGKPVTPKLWSDSNTKVLKSYPAPPKSTIDALRTMMRETVQEGTAQALKDRGDVHGKTGTAQAGNDIDHGWFTGYSGDLAFAVLVEDAGSSKRAVQVTDDFLGAT